MSSTIGVRNRTDTIKSNLKRNLSSLVTVSMFPVLGAGCKLPCAWQRLGLFAVFCKGFDLLPRLACLPTLGIRSIFSRALGPVDWPFDITFSKAYNSQQKTARNLLSREELTRFSKLHKLETLNANKRRSPCFPCLSFTSQPLRT